jgi:hypothetical protein
MHSLKPPAFRHTDEGRYLPWATELKFSKLSIKKLANSLKIEPLQLGDTDLRRCDGIFWFLDYALILDNQKNTNYSF